MFFCPNCGNLLLVLRESTTSLYELSCSTCSYVCPIERPYSIKSELKSKEVDDVLGGAEAWKNVDKTTVICPKCENNSAYFMQIQTRSADEPMTTFYKCTNDSCSHQWKEG